MQHDTINRSIERQNLNQACGLGTTYIHMMITSRRSHRRSTAYRVYIMSVMTVIIKTAADRVNSLLLHVDLSLDLAHIVSRVILYRTAANFLQVSDRQIYLRA